jgi:hypothetical protein
VFTCGLPIWDERSSVCATELEGRHSLGRHVWWTDRTVSSFHHQQNGPANAEKAALLIWTMVKPVTAEFVGLAVCTVNCILDLI